MVFKPLACTFGCCTIPQPIWITFMMQMALWNAYHLRVVLNIAITEMQEEHNATNNACPEYVFVPVPVHEAKFDFSPNIEALILYAFYIGYIFSHIPGGWLADKVGGRHVMGTCILMSCLVTLVYPTALEKGGTIAAVALRMILGVAQGPILPTVSTFIQCWVTPDHRGFYGGVAFGGSNLGTVTGNVFTGMMIKRFNSWQVPFYCWASLALIWYVIYLFTVFSGPNTHPFLPEELKQLEDLPVRKRSFKAPWLEFAKSVPIWALLAAQFGHNYLYFTVLTDLPKFLKEILKLNVEQNAYYTALPFLLLYLGTFVFSYYADVFVRKGIMTVLTTRKVYTIFSLIVPSLLLLLCVHVGCNRTLVISIYCLAVLFMGPFFAGMKVNVNDLTYNYGGTIMAIVNGIGATAGIIGPAIVGSLTADQSVKSWRFVFWTMCGVSLFTSIIYGIFAKAERQSWDFIDDEREDEPIRTK